ncbi:zinc ribbon domain-containing protein [Candidatus Saccharibacteria bacterium]|nr:zinc ribbon domain-containing protein [Candidatus Saccharibacteria bacterium]
MATTVKICSNCGGDVKPKAKFCSNCGHDLLVASHHMLVTDPSDARPVDKSVEISEHEAYFIVAPYKLAILFVTTLGLYNIYWMYKQWQMVMRRENRPLRPFWRALFSVIYVYPLFKALKIKGDVWLAVVFIVPGLTYKLPGGWWLLGYLNLIPLLVVQSRLNERSDNVGAGGHFSPQAVVVAVLGSLILLLALVGTFIPGN